MSNEDKVKELIELTETAYQEYPTKVRVTFFGADKVEFKMGIAWLHDVDIDLRPPYPRPWADTIDYTVEVIEGIGPVPYENRADCEQYVDPAKAVLSKMVKVLKDKAINNEIGLLSETIQDDDNGIMMRVEISSLL